MDPHLNIFYSYRGPSESEHAARHQLEDNLTRALIVTLDHVQGTSLAGSLLSALGFPAEETAKRYRCRLQVARLESGDPSPARRRLCIILGAPVLDVISTDDDTVRARLDATVQTATFLVGIESKVGDQVSHEQFNRHIALLCTPDTSSTVVTWSDISQAIRRQLHVDGLPPVARFVVTQFEEYLRMNGFGGLTAEHFGFFALPAEDRDELVKEGVRRSRESLMIEFRELWQTDWKLVLGNITSTADGAWAKLQPDKSDQNPHLSIGINPAGIDIFGNIETDGPFQRFRTALQRNPDPFIALLRELAFPWPPTNHGEPPWRLSIIRRVPTSRPRFDDYWPATNVAAITLRDWATEALRSFLIRVTDKPDGEHAPEIQIIRSYPARFVLNDDQLAGRLAADAARLEPFFEWLGEPVRYGSHGQSVSQEV